jgi:hypothetical protein
MSCYSDPASGGRTGGPAPAASDQPPTSAAAARKLICLRLVERTSGVRIRPPERCANEQLPGSDLCARHLGEAAADFRRIIQDAQGEMP